MSGGDWGIEAQVIAASELTDRMARLPATPVADWSRQAAEAFALLADECPVVVGLCSRVEDEEACEIEDAGVAVGEGVSKKVAGVLGGGGMQHWRIHEFGGCNQETKRVGVDELDERSAEAWSRAGAREIAFVSVPMDPEKPERRLVAGFGISETSVDGCGPARARVLGAVVPRLLARARFAFGTKDALQKSDRLTKRETEVLDHLVIGRSIKKIAELLERSPHTVHDHAKSLHVKLKASSRGELVARALGHCSMEQDDASGAWVCYNQSDDTVLR